MPRHSPIPANPSHSGARPPSLAAAPGAPRRGRAPARAAPAGTRTRRRRRAWLPRAKRGRNGPAAGSARRPSPAAGRQAPGSPRRCPDRPASWRSVMMTASPPRSAIFPAKFGCLRRTRHVGHDRDAARLAGARNNRRFRGVLIGVDHRVGQAALGQRGAGAQRGRAVRVPINDGRPARLNAAASCATALHFAAELCATRSPALARRA